MRTGYFNLGTSLAAAAAMSLVSGSVTASPRSVHYSAEKRTLRYAFTAPVEIASVMAKCAHKSKARRMFRHTRKGGVRRA